MNWKISSSALLKIWASTCCACIFWIMNVLQWLSLNEIFIAYLIFITDLNKYTCSGILSETDFWCEVCYLKPLWMVLRFVKIFEHDFCKDSWWSFQDLLKRSLKIFGRILEDPKSILEDPWESWQETEGSLRTLSKILVGRILWGSSQDPGKILKDPWISYKNPRRSSRILARKWKILEDL